MKIVTYFSKLLSEMFKPDYAMVLHPDDLAKMNRNGFFCEEKSLTSDEYRPRFIGLSFTVIAIRNLHRCFEVSFESICTIRKIRFMFWSSREWSARLRALAQLTIALHSSAEERAISKNLLLSCGEDLPEPSAMLSGTDRVACFS